MGVVGGVMEEYPVELRERNRIIEVLYAGDEDDVEVVEE
jgi:hypothetical protein